MIKFIQVNRNCLMDGSQEKFKQIEKQGNKIDRSAYEGTLS